MENTYCIYVFGRVVMEVPHSQVWILDAIQSIEKTSGISGVKDFFNSISTIPETHPHFNAYVQANDLIVRILLVLEYAGVPHAWKN